MHFFNYLLTAPELAIFYLVALFIGMAKTGVQGAGMLSVPLLATVFGGQKSSGILLPILCFADILGLWYYHRHASWRYLKELFPWAAVGTVAGTLVGEFIDDNVFKIIMAVVIFFSVALMIWLEKSNKKNVPKSRWFGASAGISGGFASMVGNLAGPIMAVYLLSMRLPKNAFIGTTAWFFLVVNLFKVPFHVFAWKTIDTNTILMDLTTLPIIALGAIVGIYIVKNLNEKVYRWFIIGTTLLAAILMLF